MESGSQRCTQSRARCLLAVVSLGSSLNIPAPYMVTVPILSSVVTEGGMGVEPNLAAVRPLLVVI